MSGSAASASRSPRPNPWNELSRCANGGGCVILRAMDQSSNLSTEPAEYYRRKAARAREVAEGVTTRAVKLRLLDLALQYDRLAAGAESATRPSEDFADQ